VIGTLQGSPPRFTVRARGSQRRAWGPYNKFMGPENAMLHIVKSLAFNNNDKQADFSAFLTFNVFVERFKNTLLVYLVVDECF
jgi:hypothetical protein